MGEDSDAEISDERLQRITDIICNLYAERFRTHVGWGKFALTAAMTINGAAAVTMLSFIGNFASSQQIKFGLAAPDLIWSMQAFCIGVAAAVMTGALAYLGEGAKLVSSNPSVQNLLLARTSFPPEPDRRLVDWLAKNLHYVSSTFWIFSWLCFCFGILRAANALGHL
jgi:hypothetical protein